MGKFTDPFISDTKKYKDLINKDSNKSNPQQAEVIEPTEVLDHGTVKGLPPSVFKAVRDQQHKLEMDTETKNKVSKAFNQLFTDLNAKYGLHVTMDFDSFTNNLGFLIEPKNKKAAEYYLSEAYGRYRVVLYGQYLQAIALLSSQILDPQYLLSESMTYDQKLDTLERLYNFMDTMNNIYEKVNIPDTDMKLEKLSEDDKPQFKLDDPNIRKFMEDTFNSIKDK